MVAFTLLSLIAIVGIWAYLAPTLAYFAAKATPTSALNRFDQSIAFSIGAKTELPPNEGLTLEQQKTIRSIVERLKAEIPEAEQAAINLRFIPEGEIGPNAFALPGGTLIITADLWNLMKGNKGAIAGVMAHEIAHVRNKHSLQRIYQSLSLYILFGFLAGGDVGPIVNEVLLEGQLVLNLAYSRRHELEADHDGILLAIKAGYEPQGLIRFLELLEERNGSGAVILSTHPSNQRRIRKLRELLQSNGLLAE